MRLPVDTNKITVLVIGEPRPVVEFGTDIPKLDKAGKPLFKLPVLLSGTGDRTDPTTTITVSGDLSSLKSGQQLRCTNLSASTWTLRDANGRDRSGLTLRADRVEVEAKPAR